MFIEQPLAFPGSAKYILIAKRCEKAEKSTNINNMLFDQKSPVRDGTHRQLTDIATYRLNWLSG